MYFLKALFIGCNFLILYTYILYPGIIFLLEKIFNQKKWKIDEHYYPFVSFIVSAYNEEDVIKRKLENTCHLKYPKDRLEIIFISDGSTDNTDNIISQYSRRRIELIRINGRKGKSYALNSVIPQTRGEICVLSDANSILREDVLKKLVRHFVDPTIGCVSGRLKFKPIQGNPLSIIETQFWNYETWLKIKEGNITSLPGANGGVYAIRKSLFKPLPADRVMVDDFLITLNIIAANYRAVSDPEVNAKENGCLRIKDSYSQKIRIGAGNFHAIRFFYPLLNPFKGFIAFILWSHKIIRWFIPFLMISIFVTNLFLFKESSLFQITLYAQCILLLWAALGFIIPLGEKKKANVIQINRRIWQEIFYFPFYFLSLNIAGFVSFLRFATRTYPPAWENHRNSSKVSKKVSKDISSYKKIANQSQ
ncbi:MAG: glycosyltransferase family 2 protein [bacterium]